VSGESRGAPRRHLFYYLEVLDKATGASLGRLGDIHDDGVLLLASGSLRVGIRFVMSIQLPEPIGRGRGTLDLEVEVRWSRKDASGNLYQSGCSFISLSQADREYIEELVQRIGFSDGQRKILLKNDSNIFVEQEEGSGHHE